jgi:hypothetical protein
MQSKEVTGKVLLVSLVTSLTGQRVPENGAILPGLKFVDSAVAVNVLAGERARGNVSSCLPIQKIADRAMNFLGKSASP